MYLYVYVCIYVFEEGVGFEGLLPSPAFWFLNRIHNIYFMYLVKSYQNWCMQKN